jgi:hypothetical protein
VGLEDPLAKSADDVAGPLAVKAGEAVMAAGAGDTEFLLDFVEAENQLLGHILPDYDLENPSATQEEFDRAVSRTPKRYQTVFKNYLNAYMNYFKTIRTRDLMVARNMLALNQSGIHLAGFLHAYPTAKLLEKECRKLMETPAVTNSYPALVAPVNNPTNGVR